MALLLEAEGLDAFHGATQALHGLDLTVAEGEVVALLGRNGAGKTTTIRAVMGLVRRAGRVRVMGRDTAGLSTVAVARLGVGLVPEGRRVFPNLSVSENLLAVAAERRGVAEPWTLGRVMDLFPGLAARRAAMGNLLSGGEQQMLAVGRALMTNPRLLILDEATEGLAPLVRETIWEALAALKASGQAILVVDKNLDRLALLADHAVLIEKGRLRWTGDRAALTAEREEVGRLLAVH